MIRVENLSKSYASLKVLEKVNLQVVAGEVIAIIGPSGSGKSVFLRSIELLEKPDSGRIWIGGDEITAKGADVDKIRRRMGMVYQQFNLFSHMDVLDNIILAPMRLRGLTRSEAVKKAKELLAMVSLESKIHAMPEELSGGQKQRIAIVRSLAMDPDIMLFDEPTSALDPTMVGEVLATIRALTKKGLTMLIVTHEMSFAKEFASRVLYMDERGIYEQGTPAQIFEHPQREKTQSFIHKLKSFDKTIISRDFDLLSLMSQIELFCEKYNIDSRRKNVLLLSVEELLSGIIGNCFDQDEKISININISYGQADGILHCIISCQGKEYNPFYDLSNPLLDMDDDTSQLGYLMLRGLAKEINHSYENNLNRILIII